MNLRSYDFIERGRLRLDGQWRFIWRHWPSRGEARAERPPPSPVPVEVPDAWTNYDVDGVRPGPFGYATYRLKVLLDEPRDDMALRGAVSSAHRLYVNGHEVLSVGLATPTASGFVAHFDRRLSRPFRLERENEIVVEAANFVYHEGGLLESLQLGPHELLTRDRRDRSWFALIVIGAFFFIALYHVLLFWLDPRERSAIYFAGIVLSVVVRVSLTNERVFHEYFPGTEFAVYARAVFFATYAIVPFCGLFIYELFRPFVHPRAVWIVAGGPVLMLPAVLFLPLVDSLPLTLGLFTLFTAGGGLYGLYVLIRAARAGESGATAFFVAFAVFLLFGINDLLFSLHRIETGYYLEFGFAGFIFAQAFTVSRRIILERRRSETLARDLEATNTELRSLDRLKDEFLANTSHELRTPLHGIIGMADALRDDREQRLTPASDRRLELIIASGRRLSRLVGDILDFAKLRHKDVHLTVAPLLVRPLVQLQIELIRYNIASDRRLLLFNEVPEDLPPVLADEARLTQILHNLLGNAVKFTDEGEIRVSARRLDARIVEIRVEDTGIGIKPEDREQIFQPFEQAPGTTGGTGLGLSIARSLAELQGGRLWLDPVEGPGARLCFTLPVAGPGDQGIPDSEITLPSAPIEQSLAQVHDARDVLPRQSPGARNGKRILLVDDEPVNLEVMSSYLESTDLRADLASDAGAARSMLEQGPPPECLVLDIMMPGTSGLELARELRARFSAFELPILMVTAKSRTADLLAAIDAGANDYLTKPFEKKEFLLRVGNLVELSSSHRDVERSRSAVRDAAKRERARINSDLHDHLGASLTDLKLFSETARQSAGVNPDFARRLEEKVDSAVRLLRNDLLDLEDLSLLEDDFMEGIQMIILRRYVEAGRIMDFRAPESGREQLNHRLGEGLVGVLYAVIKETVTNDLKYGTGPSAWEFIPTASELCIEFRARSRYRLATHGTGQGTAGMLRRLTEVGGRLRIQMEEEPEPTAEQQDQAIEITIAVPL